MARNRRYQEKRAKIVAEMEAKTRSRYSYYQIHPATP